MCFVWQRALIFFFLGMSVTPSGEIILRNPGLNDMMLTCYLWSLSTLIQYMDSKSTNYCVSWSTERICICF